MSVSVPYMVDLLALNGQAWECRYSVGDDFFASQQGHEIDGGHLDVDVAVTPQGDAFELTIGLQGEVTVPCDRCLEPVSIPVEGSDSIKVVLGAEDADDGDVVTVDEKRGTLDVAWHIYELAALEIPIHHAHAEGECNEAMAQLLAQHSVEATEDEE